MKERQLLYCIKRYVLPGYAAILDTASFHAYLTGNRSNLMIQEFCFRWNGRQWNGYFNAIAHETVIAHFEDDVIRDAIGQTLKYSKTESGTLTYLVQADVQLSHTGIYDAIQKGVEVRLGTPLQHYLN